MFEALAPALRDAVGLTVAVLLPLKEEVGVAAAVPVPEPEGVAVGVPLPVCEGVTLLDSDTEAVADAEAPSVRAAVGDALSVELPL